MKWLAELFWNPPAALDLVDSGGFIDHGKVMGFILFVAFYVLIWNDKLPSLGHTITLAAIGFGSIAFRTFLKSKIVQAQEIITEKRDTQVGFQPTP